jgi:predicted dithiol-disulfide oxidoreductase (DUF899 family)
MFPKGGDGFCSLCSFFIDQYVGALPHLRSKNISFAVAGKGGWQDMTTALKKKEGWTVGSEPKFPIVSALNNNFNEAFGVSFPEGSSPAERDYNYGRTWQWGTEAPGLSVFRKDPASNKVHHTYSTFSAGLGGLSIAHSLIDLTPSGTQEKENRNMWYVT